MRDYSKVGPRFWTGETGKHLRSIGTTAQVLGVYLLSCPAANMIGLYYLPMTMAAHETGLSIDQITDLFPRLSHAPSEPLGSPFEGVFARFDPSSETVFVTEMARHQVGDHLSRKDNRHKAVIRELEQYRKTRYFNDFLDVYGDAFELADVPRNRPRPRALEAPSKPLRSQEQEQEQEQEQKQEHASSGCARESDSGDRAPTHEEFRQAYPKFTGRPNWITALHHCRLLIDRGEASWSSLMAAARRYATYCAAGGVSGPQYVLTPVRFFGDVDKPWSLPWNPPPKPKTDTELRQEREKAELIALAEGRAARGLLHCRDPMPVDTPSTYGTYLREAENELRNGKATGRAGGGISRLAAAKSMPK